MEDTTLNWNDLNSETIVMNNIINQPISNSNRNAEIPNIQSISNNQITKSSIDNLILNTKNNEKVNNNESSFYDVFQGHTGGGNIDYNFESSTSMMFDTNNSISTISGYSFTEKSNSNSDSNITYSLSNIDMMNSETSDINNNMNESSFNINFEDSMSMSNLNTSDINVLSISDI